MTDPDTDKTGQADDATEAAPDPTTETRTPRHAMPDDLDSADEADSADAADTLVEDDVESAADDIESATDDTDEAAAHEASWPRVVAFAVLPALALILALGAGVLKWQEVAEQREVDAAAEAVVAAKATTTALLSYQPDTVEQQLVAARELLTGRFLDSYTALTNNVIIPGAKEQRVAASAATPAAAAISADTRNAEVLVMINQTVSVGDAAPSSTASTVKVKLEKVGDRWLISDFATV